MFNESYLGGSVNFFSDIEDYMDLRRDIDTGSDRFFMSINRKATSPRKFFTKQALEKNMFSLIVKRACQAENISGSGSKNWVTSHSLRRTLATILFEAGHSDSSVAVSYTHLTLPTILLV